MMTTFALVGGAPMLHGKPLTRLLQLVLHDFIGPPLPPETTVLEFSCSDATVAKPSKAHDSIKVFLDAICTSAPEGYPLLLPYSLELINPYHINGVANCHTSPDSQGNIRATMTNAMQCQACLQHIRDKLLSSKCPDAASAYFRLEDCSLQYIVNFPERGHPKLD